MGVEEKLEELYNEVKTINEAMEDGVLKTHLGSEVRQVDGSHDYTQIDMDRKGKISARLYAKDENDDIVPIRVAEDGRFQLSEDIEVSDIDIGNVNLLNVADEEINPATEPTLSSLESKDFATETTLASLEGKDFATETTLASIDSDFDAPISSLLQATEPLDVSGAEIEASVDIQSQTLARLTSLLELDDGTGTYGEIQRRANSIRTSIENDEVGLATETTLDNIDTVLNSGEIDVDIASQTLTELGVQLDSVGGTSQTGADWTPLLQNLDVALSTLLQTSDLSFDGSNLQIDLAGLTYGTLEVEQQTPVGVENTGGAQIDPATETSLTAEQPRESRDRVFSNLEYGSDTVSTSGTSEALNGGTSLTIPNGAKLTIKAKSGNSAEVYVGDSTGVSLSTDGYPLSAGETVTLNVDDVSNVAIDVATDGEGVNWIVEST